jgi:hypothetical protein
MADNLSLHVLVQEFALALICATCGTAMRDTAQSARDAHCGLCNGTMWRSAAGEIDSGRVIDAVVVADRRIEPTFRRSRPLPAHGRPAPPRPISRRRGMLHKVAEASAIIAISMTVAIGVVFHASIADAFAGLAGASPRYEGLEFRSVRTETRFANNGRTLLVEGEVVNRSGSDRPLPAIRMTLRAAGNDVYSWVVEPAPAYISAGGAVGFRSVVAPPDQREGQVALTLAER